MIIFDAIAAYLICAAAYFMLRAGILWILSVFTEDGGYYGQLRASGRPRFIGHLFKRK